MSNSILFPRAFFRGVIAKSFFAALMGGGLILGGCQVRREASAELILSGSVAESSETVELDPVFLARQRLVESRFFGFGENDSKSDLKKAPSELSINDDFPEDDVDLAITSNSVAEIPGSFRGVALQWPVQGSITSPFGMRHGRLHAGIDIKGAKGDPVYSAGDGQVLFSKARKAYGKAVIVGHAHDNQTLYAHLNQFAVREGQYVKRGDLVGYVGRTGRATGFHLHFETRVSGGIPQNPMKFLPTTFSDLGLSPQNFSLLADAASKVVSPLVQR